MVIHCKTTLVFCLFGLFGLFGAVLFNNTSPRQYESTVFIKMIEVSDNLGTLNKVEDPLLLISRLKQPSTYTQKEVDSCFSVNDKFTSEELISKVTVSLVAKSDSVVQLKIKRPTKELAAQCMQAIYEMISEQQLRIKADKDKVNLIMLSNYRKRYKELNSSNVSIGEREEIRFLLEKISMLDFGYLATQNQVTVITPIFTSENRLWPKKLAILVIGVLIGLFLGWIVLNRMQIWKIYSVKK